MIVDGLIDGLMTIRSIIHWNDARTNRIQSAAQELGHSISGSFLFHAENRKLFIIVK